MHSTISSLVHSTYYACHRCTSVLIIGAQYYFPMRMQFFGGYFSDDVASKLLSSPSLESTSFLHLSSTTGRSATDQQKLLQTAHTTIMLKHNYPKPKVNGMHMHSYTGLYLRQSINLSVNPNQYIQHQCAIKQMNVNVQFKCSMDQHIYSCSTMRVHIPRPSFPNSSLQLALQTRTGGMSGGWGAIICRLAACACLFWLVIHFCPQKICSYFVLAREYISFTSIRG